MSKRVAAIENFNQLSAEQQKLYITAVVHYRDEYLRVRKDHDAISVAAGFHKEMDEVIASKGMAKEASCGNHCSFCCHIYNEITEDEAELLIEHAKELNLEIDRRLLEKQAALTEDQWMELKHADRRCVFLSKEGSCGVYEHRPASCRKYFVASDPKLCDLEGNRTEDVLVILNSMAEIIYAGAGVAQRTGLMADMLNEKLNEHHKH